MRVEGYEIDILVPGFPGKSVCHGGLDWSTVALVRGHGHTPGHQAALRHRPRRQDKKQP